MRIGSFRGASFGTNPHMSMSFAAKKAVLSFHLVVGVEQNRNQNFEQKPKLVPVQSGYRKYRHTGYNFQEESRKNIFFLYIHSKSER